MSIKNYISIIVLLAIQHHVFAQKDTSYQVVRQENGEYSAPVVETPFDRFFRTKVPSNWMFKVDLSRSVNFSNTNIVNYSTSASERPIVMGVEYKLSPAFSVGAYYGISLGYQSFSWAGQQGQWLSTHTLGAEGRWYHDMKKRIAQGKSANNFGGKYLAAEAYILNTSVINNFWDKSRFTVRYGMQQRFLQHGFFDVNIGLGISNQLGPLKRPKVFSTDQRVSVGLAAFLPKATSSTANGGLCDVLHCQDENYKMLKINLFNAVNFQTSGRASDARFRPNLAFEHKIGRSPFSVELDADLVYNRTKFQYYSFLAQKDYYLRYTAANWNARGELRWYYNMRKRILNGNSGNNLSGVFTGVQLHRSTLIQNAVHMHFEEANSIYSNPIMGSDYWACNLVWGVQQRLLDRGFIQFKVGAGSTFGASNYRYEGDNKPLTKLKKANELNLVADLKVGFAF